MVRYGMLVAVAVVLAAGCGQGQVDPISAAPSGEVPRCDDVPDVAAPDDRYRDEPVYVGNEMPTDEVRAWASGQPGFEDLWVDRDRNGWITVAFSQDAEQRQAELRERFPDVGAVVVPVDWRLAELNDLQEDVVRTFGNESVVSSVSVTQGVVSIGFGVLTDERRAAVNEAFSGRRVCVSGGDPAEAPTPGPQPSSGDGWRLLSAEQDAGEVYRTHIATDDESYAELWDLVGLAASRPEVDLDREVVIWFGAVYGSGCSDLRLDDVVVDLDRAMVHPRIVLVDPPVACNADANPYAYVVAVERQRLPEGAFAIQLGADDPPGGAPEERTYVEVDLRAPGAVAGPDDLRQGQQGDLPPEAVSSGGYVEPGFPSTYRLDARCGVGWLGVLNAVTWRAQDETVDPVPAAWEHRVEPDGTLLVEVTVRTGSPPTATAAADGHEIVYVPAEDQRPPCD